MCVRARVCLYVCVCTPMLMPLGHMLIAIDIEKLCPLDQFKVCVCVFVRVCLHVWMCAPMLTPLGHVLVAIDVDNLCPLDQFKVCLSMYVAPVVSCLALTKGPGNSSISLIDLFCLK